MHELSIVMSIIDQVTAAAQAEAARSINVVELEVGTFSGVMIDSLKFCFDVATRDTQMQGAKLIIHSVAAQGKCLECNLESKVESLPVQCPGCGEYLLSIANGQDIRIVSITIDE
jgi:hydrogenase nickel incorporation protein HypA/HybF